MYETCLFADNLVLKMFEKMTNSKKEIFLTYLGSKLQR